MLPFGSLGCMRPKGAERLTPDLGTSCKGHIWMQGSIQMIRMRKTKTKTKTALINSNGEDEEDKDKDKQNTNTKKTSCQGHTCRCKNQFKR